MTLKHSFNSLIVDDGTPPGAVGPDEWNADHVITTLQVPTTGTNLLTLAGGTAGNPVTLTASGSDASIPIHLAPKGDQGFVQLGADTYGVAGWAGSDTNIEIYDLATRTVLSNAIYVERYAGDIASSVTNGLNFSVGTQGAGATQNIGSIFGIQGNIVSTLPAGRSVGNTFAAATFQASNSGAGTIPFANGVYSEVSNFSTGTIGEGYSFAAIRPRNNGGGTYPNYYAYWADEATEPTNSYYFWADARGVFRIKSDNTFDGVYQAITALYNPQFTKYTAGAANFERIVQYWSGNVATIGTEAGGTGTQRALNLVGSSVKANGSALLVSGGALGTPLSGTLTSCTGLPAAGVVGTAATLGLNTFTRLQTITQGAAAESLIVSTGGSNTGTSAVSALDFSWTLNTSGSPDVFALRVTDTARGGSTKLFNLYAGASGTTSEFSVDRLGNVVGAAQITAGSNLIATSDIRAGGATNYIYWNNRTSMRSPADGDILISNNNESSFGRMMFGGTTSSFPALKRSTTNLQVRLADDSGYAPIDASAYKVGGVAGADFGPGLPTSITVVKGIITAIS